MWHLATAHAQTLHSGWAYNRVKIPLCKNFEAKEGMDVYSYFREGAVLNSITNEYHKQFIGPIWLMAFRPLDHTKLIHSARI